MTGRYSPFYPLRQLTNGSTCGRLQKKEMVQTSKEANARYDAKSTKHYGFKFNLKTDADIIEALDAAPNKQALIKEALRAYIGKERKDG